MCYGIITEIQTSAPDSDLTPHRGHYVLKSQTIRETYDRCSGFYDLFFQPCLGFGRERALELLDIHESNRVLEIGVGTGLSFPYYPSHIQVIGLDYSRGMLLQASQARDTASCPISLLQMDAQHLAFPDHSFDRIIAAYVMTVIPEPAFALREIIRVARPGARVVFINHLRSDNPVWAWVEDTFHPLFSKIGLFSLDRNLLQILKDVGITKIAIEPTSRLGLHHIISFTTPE